MAIIEFVNQKKVLPSQKKSSLKRAIDYIMNPEKTPDGFSFGINCNPETAYEEMIAVKQLYGKEDGRQYIHFVQSFKKDDKVTPELAKEIAERLIKEFSKFDGFQVVASVHTNTDVIHTHFIVNSVNAETGPKWKFSSQEMQNLKNHSDRLCAEYGLSVVNKNIRHIKIANEFEEIAREDWARSHEEKNSQARNISWKGELYHAVCQCLWHSVDKEDFIEKMNELGYKVNWSDTRKYITFETPDGHKCRNSKLYPPDRFTKESMEKQFEYNGMKKEFATALYKCSYNCTSKEEFLKAMEEYNFVLENSEDTNTYLFRSDNGFVFDSRKVNQRKFTPTILEKTFSKNMERKQLFSDIASASFYSLSTEEFMKKMSEKGYEVSVIKNSFGYKTPSGIYFSDSSFPYFYKKESLDYRFKINSDKAYFREERKSFFRLYLAISNTYYSAYSLSEYRDRMQKLGYEVNISIDGITYKTPEGFSISDREDHFMQHLKKEKLEEKINENRNYLLLNDTWYILRSAVDLLKENENGKPLTTIGSLEGQALKEWMLKQKFRSRFETNKQKDKDIER